MYAIFKLGGHQYRVEPGQSLMVERLAAEPGSAVEFGDVMFIGGDTVQVGRPFVDGAVVRATVQDQMKGRKLMVFKYRRKNRYRIKTGHRQKYTRLTIDAIQA
jgi:large subunit ribosomal protein L21